MVLSAATSSEPQPLELAANGGSKPAPHAAGQFDDERTNVLFVGRMIPNKRIENVIRSFHAYQQRFNPRSRLLLVGSHGGFEKYLTMLHQLVATLGVSDVHFSGHVSNEELTAYYEAADVFLCASEHEGFCVPLVEAMAADVPVLAYAAGAVPETLGGAGLLFAPKDLEVAAEMLGMGERTLYRKIQEWKKEDKARSEHAEETGQAG